MVDDDGQLVGMSIASSALGFNGGDVVSYHSTTPLFCGIFIPLGILILTFVFYFICSANNMDLPGSNYIPPAAADTSVEATEMKAL